MSLRCLQVGLPPAKLWSVDKELGGWEIAQVGGVGDSAGGRVGDSAG